MRRIWKWILILLAILLGLALAGAAGVYVLAEAKINQVYAIPDEVIPIPTDAAAIARGEHLATVIFFCTECHGEGLGGQLMFEDPLTGRLVATNLTAGQGGLGRSYTDADWVRAIRHGVRKDGKAGLAMSSNLFWYMSDADVGALLAYIKSLPPVDNELQPTRLGPMGHLFVLQEPDVLSASVIDHAAPRPPAPEPGVTAAYGQYLAHVCTICHGENLAGWVGDPDQPEMRPPRNLTPAGNLARWSEVDFINAIRTGQTPEGDQLDPEAMPWQTFGKMTDDELKAIWLYLQTLPPAESQERR